MRRSEAVDLKSRFLRKLYERYNNGVRSGVHVSDLTYCVRQSFFRKTNPQPHSLKTLQFFVDGGRRHEALQELLGVRAEVPVERFGVKGTVDILADAPIEIKTTRAANALPEHYFKQLGFYAVLCGTNEGYLVVQRINCGDDGEPWEFYYVQWSVDEIEGLEHELKDKSDMLRQALEIKDFSLLPQLDSSMRWKCRYCLYSNECDRGSS